MQLSCVAQVIWPEVYVTINVPVKDKRSSVLARIDLFHGFSSILLVSSRMVGGSSYPVMTRKIS